MSNSFDEQIDQCIISLKIIGMLQKNGRLCIRRGVLCIEPDDKLQTFRRWFNKDTREQCMIHIRNTILNAISITKNIMNKKIEIELADWTLKRILKELTTCQNGLINLKTTYSEDSSIIAHIDTLIDRLRANCEEIHDYIKNLMLNNNTSIFNNNNDNNI